MPNDAYQEAQSRYLGPEWKAWFKSLEGKRVNLGGIGLRNGVGHQPSLGLLPPPGQEDVARSGAINAYLGDLQDTRDPRTNVPLDIAEAELRAMREQSEAKRAMAIANDPNTSAFGRPIAQRENGAYTTLAPNPAEPQPAVNRQAIAAQMAPGLIAPPAPAPPVTFGAPVKATVNGKAVFVRPGSDGLVYDTARRPIDPAAIAPADNENEPLVSIMGPDNRPILVPRSQAAGKTPASSREQGRPVTSGDAGRIAEIDTSLSDLDVLEKTLGTTGAGSKIGAMLPNVVTEMTGWGSDSKSRQGTIDRVKQVIGKALEGGVLRKEDEAKYEKILPTIGDPPEVAKTKLQGLKTALVARRQTTLEALADAGYETSRFDARAGAPVPAAVPRPAPTAAPTGPVEGARQPIPGGSGVAEFRGGKWIRVQ